MKQHELIRSLKRQNDSKIVLMVADGLGGLPREPGGPTELESARTPNLDELARWGVQGAMIPVKPGITPGSGPAHLALFGYDPLEFRIGRGALEATGIGFELGEDDIAVRCNFCTLDAQGRITDRRAGRIATEQSTALVEKLRSVKIDGVEVFVEPVREHRFVVVLRAAGLEGNVEDTDPQTTGVPPLEPMPLDEESRWTAEVAHDFIRQARGVLADEPKANGLTMRGFAPRPALPSYEELYGLRAAAIAVYPMYKGLAKLAGMEIIGAAQTLAEQMAVLEENWSDYDFFFIHFKYTDSTGEDGDFDAKVKRIEELDAAMPRVTALEPTVLIVTGDHSTPCLLRSHSWHPVPTLLAARSCRTDAAQAFSETESTGGGLGQFEARYLMSLAMAHAERLEKYGA